MIKGNDILEGQYWKSETLCDGEDFLHAIRTTEGRITVLDRMTGFSGGIRDIETGFKNNDGDFWLASGNFDIRAETDDTATVDQAIELIKKNANTCVPG